MTHCHQAVDHLQVHTHSRDDVERPVLAYGRYDEYVERRLAHHTRRLLVALIQHPAHSLQGCLRLGVEIQFLLIHREVFGIAGQLITLHIVQSLALVALEFGREEEFQRGPHDKTQQKEPQHDIETPAHPGVYLHRLVADGDDVARERDDDHRKERHGT